MSTATLQIENLSKQFRSHWTFRPIRAIEDLSLEVRPGEIYGFIGHNGAGKTTTIKCIVGLLRKTSGSILLDGEELQSAAQRNSLGYLPEHPYFYDHLSVQETLEFFGGLSSLSRKTLRERIDELLELVGLTERRKTPVRLLSKGLQQRVGFAQAILNRPKLLLLDEPFSGLDPQGRIEFRELILDLRQQGTTVFLSSHILSDVEHLCERVAILARGELKLVFSPKDAPELFGESFELTIDKPDQTSECSKTMLSIAEIKSSRQTTTTLAFEDYEIALQALFLAKEHQLRIHSFQCIGKSLEDVFIAITQDSADSEQGDAP